MRRRVVSGTVLAALVLALAGPATAAPRVTCAEGFEAVCTVIAVTCTVTKENPCHP
jgi:Flp pilus assembly protein TadD